VLRRELLRPFLPPRSSLTSDNNILQLIQDLKNANVTVDSIANGEGSLGEGILTGSHKSFEEE
jgi:hypothetical protein